MVRGPQNVPESAVGATLGDHWSPRVSLHGEVQRKQQPLRKSQLDHFIPVSYLKKAIGQPEARGPAGHRRSLSKDLPFGLEKLKGTLTLPLRCVKSSCTEGRHGPVTAEQGQ